MNRLSRNPVEDWQLAGVDLKGSDFLAELGVLFNILSAAHNYNQISLRLQMEDHQLTAVSKLSLANSD